MFFLALVSCRGAHPPPSCGGAANCLASEPGVVIGNDEAARLAATRELRSAAASYSAWFPGQTARPGLVMLDAAAAGQAALVRGTSWTLTYDVANGEPTEGGSASPQSGRRSSRARAEVPERGRETGEFDVTRPGVLAHEICHRHAAGAFARTWGRKAPLPDMLDEIAAVSCESEALRTARVDLFARLFADGKVISWEGFLVARHPLKSDPAMVRALKRLGKPGQAAVTFKIAPGSPYEGKVAIFYSQAAAFGEFLSTDSCRGRHAIGELLESYDPRGGLDSWLRDHGRRLCLPSSATEFERSFSGYIRTWEKRERRTGTMP